jgi:hypothetical protein
MTMHRRFSGFWIALISLVCASALLAQRDLATLVGTVTDPSGAVIANAKVTVTETSTNEVYTLTTNSAGEFIRPALKPSTYTISVTAPGFKKAEQKDIELRPGERTGINIALTVGDIGQTVEVTASAPLLQTESTQVGAALDSKQVTEVPLGGQRVVTFLARLSPGVVPGEAGSRDGAGGGFSANGVRSNGQNNFLLNGVDNNVNTIDFLNQTSYSVGPSVEAISEMTIQTNGYNAEYGRAAGAVINVNIKSGSNQLHGSAFEFLQNKDLDANIWGNNYAGKPRGPFIQNQFGGTLGGPILKNKLFIFGDYQGTNTHSSAGLQGLGFSGLYTIPTPAEITGNFSSILGAAATGQDSNGNAISFLKGAIYDPNSTVGGGANPITRTPFPGNVIPQSRIDPSIQKIMQLFPGPNEPVITGTQPANDYFYNTPGTAVTYQGDSRVDYHLSDKSTLFGSVSWSNTYKTQTPPLPGALDNSGFTGHTEYDLNRNGQISYTRVWTPSLVTESRASFTRLVTSRHIFDANTDDFKNFGIGGFDPTTTYAMNGGLPTFSASGYSGFGGGGYNPSLEYNNVWDLVQNVAISKGTHALKMGFEFRSIKFPFFQLPDNHGGVAYSSNETAFPSAKTSSLGATVGNSTGDAIASALLGQIDNSSMSTANFMSSQKVAYGAYVQDDWKVSQKLTLNLGVRYELWSPTGEQWGRQANYDLQTNTLYIPQGNNCNAALPPNFATQFPAVIINRCQVSNYLVKWDKLDIGPRIGIAYHVRDKMVLRVGYGIFYGGEENQGGSPNRAEGVPFNETVNLSRAQGISSFIGISDPLCTGCDSMPGGLTGGFPANPFAYPAPIKLLGVQSDYRNALVHKWNVILQRELPWDMSVELGYTGNHQAHQVILGNTDPYPNLGTTNTSISSGTLQEIQPACPPPTCVSVGNGLTETVSNGFGNYAAGDIKVEKRFSHGFQFLSAYTWSHALANAGTTLSGATNFGFLDQTNWASSYSSAAWDIRHSFTTGFNYDLPFGKGKQFAGNVPKAADMIIGGWHSNGLLTLRTGQPLTLNGTSCQGVWSKCLPDIAAGYVANQAPAGGRTPNEWFDINAYQVAAPLTGGNLGLESNTGPPTKTMDFSMFKDIPFTERIRMQFRAEAFNLGNFAVLSQPDASLADAASLKGNGNFGKITSSVSGSERHVQFALRFQF